MIDSGGAGYHRGGNGRLKIYHLLGLQVGPPHLQLEIERPPAVEMLAGHFVEGDRIVVDASDGALTFQKRAAVAVAS